MSRTMRLPGFLVASVLAGALPCLCAQSPRQLDALAESGRWAQIVALLEPLGQRTAEQDFAYGRALAHLDRLSAAARALEAGRRQAPRDARFPGELAGVAFRQKHYPEAARCMRRALRLRPGDAYAEEFLATVYFLEGNLPAALRYWNRVGKPRVHEIRADPPPRVDAALLDRAFAFAPASTLTLGQWLDTQTRVRGLGIFPQRQFDLRARPEGDFDVVLRNRERNGMGNSRLEAAFWLLHALPFQALTLDFFNARRQAINFTSQFRWDENKRRLRAEVSGPFERSARFRYEIGLDVRNENWALRNGFTGPAPVLASLNLRREAGGVALELFSGEKFRWRLGAEVSHRDMRSVNPGSVLTPQLAAAGIELKQVAQVESMLLRAPERRFTLEGAASAQTGRLWAAPQSTFEKLQGSLAAQWFPRAEGDDYATRAQLRAGRTAGSVPFDELFMLGVERDNDLPMRAHIGTRDGRKGSAPLGRNYLLSSWEVDKDLYANGLLAVKLGPFIDLGAIADGNPALGSHQWLYDTGAQLKLRAFAVTLAFSYGKDLRTGNNAFYVNLLPSAP